MNRQYFSKKIERRHFTAGGAAAGISLMMPISALAAEERKLSFYNWDTYIGETTLADFHRKTGIKPTEVIFGAVGDATNEILQGNSGHDVFVPSQDNLKELIERGALLPLNRELIPNFKNLSKEWRRTAFDPKGKYSIPYMWGTMGIGYRKSKSRGNMGDMKWLLDSNRYSGRIAWQNDATTMVQIAVAYLGEDLNTTDRKIINEAGRLLSKQRKHVNEITDDDGQQLLLDGVVDVCLEWSGDISQAQREDSDIDYALAPNGSFAWYDSLVIPKDAPHPKNAHRFINYLLDAQVGRDIAEYIGYATPNKAALGLTSKAYRADPIQFPPASILRKLPVQAYLGEEYDTRAEEIWEKVIAS